MKDKLISIIIPAYNAEKYIERCLKSVINQTYKTLEILVIDDGSSDGTGKICDEFAKRDSRLIIIHKENEGVSKARNDGLKVATGEYVLFVDSDDWLENDMCELMLKKAQNDNLDIVVCEYKNYYENSKEFECISLKNYENLSFLDVISDEKTQYGGFPWNKLIKKSIIEFKFNESVHFYENLLFFLMNSQKQIKYGVVHNKLYNYCINDTSAVHSKKYSIKRLTILDAMNLVIPMVSQKLIDNYKYVYLNSYYNNYYGMKMQKLNKDVLKKYVKNISVYYKDLMNSQNISTGKKIKILIIHRFGFIYELFIRCRR